MVIKMKNGYKCILAIVNNGFSEEAMEAAKACGAKGGTVLHGRGTISKEAEKMFNISIQPEKEIVMIVSSAEQKKDIMKAIMQNAGIDSKAHSLVFSLPVTDTAGFRFADTVEKD